MKILSVLLIALVLLAGYQSASAQSGESWRVTVFDRIEGRLYVLTSSGIQSGPAISLPDGFRIWDARLSPDEHYFVFKNETDGQVWVADLTAGTCCLELAAALSPAYLSPISPDSTQIAVSMINAPTTVFDLATGQPVATIPVNTAQFGEWLADGLRLAASSWGGERWGELEGFYQIWNPVSNTLSEPVEPFNLQMKKLPATGELLIDAAVPAYPLSGFPSAYTPASNVIKYDASLTAPEERVVYFNPNYVNISAVNWVADGQAFLVETSGAARSSAENILAFSPDGEDALVFRDGHQMPVTMPGYSVFTGTPDGWIVFSWETGTAAVVQLLPGDQLNTIPLDVSQSMNWILLGSNFQLGGSVSVSPFALVTPPAFTTCPGFLPSRVWPGTYALTAEASNLYSTPSLQATPITNLPADEMFAVISGPECAENTAWWQVEYRGTQGWLSEGQDSTYWLQPIG